MAAVNSNQAIALGSITRSTNDSSVDWQQSLDWFTFMYFVYTSTATLLFVVYLQPEDARGRLVTTSDT
jgi:hypothetical protein